MGWTAALAAAAGLSDPAPPGLQPEDLHRLQSVGEARIAPDGRRVAFTIRRADGPGAPRSEAWILETASGRRTRLGHAAAWNLRWSPDGAHIAFLAAGAEGATLMAARADGSGERRLAAVQGTNDPLPSTAEALAWSPDGRHLAFVSAEAQPAAEPPDPVVITRYLYKPTSWEGRQRFSDGRRLHVFLAPAAGGPVRQLTRGPHHEHSLAWSPRGDEIALVSDRDGDERVFDYDLYALRVADGALRVLGDTPSAEYAPAWSPDGRRIAFLGTRRPLTSSETTMEDEHAWVMEADGQGRREVGAAIDNRQGEPAWTADGAALLLSVQERGRVVLYRLPVAGAGPQRVAPSAERSSVGSWSASAGGALAYALATPGRPAELYVREGPDERRLVALNEELLASRSVAEVEAFSFPSFDGTEIEAFLTRPLAPSLAPARHPLVVILHGGPHAQQGPAFHPRAQAYAARGWASLMVNYRGSTGYGQKLADAIFGDQNGGEARDVLAAVDAALARYPWLDGERTGVEGVSYGGQLANWLVTQTGRFRAGVSIAGISNLVSFHYTAYYHDYLPVEFGAYPHERGLADRLWERSPLRHAGRVRTPVLLLHGENDSDVPVGEAEQFYVALHEVGVPTVLVRYPREGHGLRETAHVVDALRRSIEWYEAWFARPRPSPRPLRAPAPGP